MLTTNRAAMVKNAFPAYLMCSCLLLAMIPLGCTPGYSGHDMAVDCDLLRFILNQWHAKGRPKEFDVERVVEPGKVTTFFMATNIVASNGRSYQCRFGSRSVYRPGGFLAITDEGVTMWISEGTGKVTLSPERRSTVVP